MGILLSPDGLWGLAEEGGNLIALNQRDPGRRLALTSDGEPLNGYGTHPGAISTARRAPEDGTAVAPVAVWSPDSHRVAVQRLDERGVGELHLVENLVRQGDRRTRVRSYRHPLAGEENVPQAELWVIEVPSARHTRVDLPAQQLLWLTPIELGRVWWEDSSRLYVLVSERGERAIEFYEVDATTGAARRILREKGSSYVEANLDISRAPNVSVLGDSDEVIWFSERTGWGHLELCNARTGRMVRPLTQGEWVVRDVVHVDAATRQVWFTAGGREAGRDPYFRHLYRVGLDGGSPVLLSPEDADHEVSLDEEADTWRIRDEYARVDGPRVCVIRDLWSGEIIETRSEQTAAPTTAEPFSVLARDGTTHLYGVIFRPVDFDPSRRYPVIDHIYGFPQTIATPKRSAEGPWQALADLGFVVVVLDGLGTAFRSKAFHDVSYGALQDATLPDHVAALRQLASRYPWVDLERVGIYGSSGGGTSTVRALLEYPEFFRVGVAIAGGYDQRDSIAYILEKYQGPDPATWAATDLLPLAGQLRGRLLLVWGELDDNVHPISSMRMLDAFISAGRDVDVLIVPGADHFVSRHPHVHRRLAGYFIEHL